MDPSTGAPSPDKLAMESSFRKLSADAANRKYRRHRSSSNSDSSSAEDSPEHQRSSKRGRSRSPVQHKEGHSKETENLQKKDDTRDPERGSSHSRSDKCHESHRHSERHSYGASRESKRHDDYRRYHDRHADEDERSYPRSSRSARESRPDGYSDRARRDSISDRSRGNWRNVDNYHGEKSDNSEYRSKNKEKEAYSTRDHANNRERERHKYRSLEGEKRDHYRIPGKYKDDYASTRDEYKRYPEEKEKTKSKETIEQEAAARRKRNGKESEKRSYGRGTEGELKDERRSLFSSVGPDVKKEQYLEGNSGKATIGSSEDDKPKQVSEVHDRATSNSFNSSSNESGASEDVNAAKVAAMKAAALVNRNIVGFGGVGVGHLSTDQKKKLLWGNKKNNAAEETTKHWDLNLFSDRERQEKFNKLMGVKGSVVPENKTEKKDGGLEEEAKKREELDMDLEKHYIAGLRRRDGRTVGLGL